MFAYQKKMSHETLKFGTNKKTTTRCLGACAYKLITNYKSVLALNLRFGDLYLFKLKHSGEDWLAITRECLESSIAANGS
jgi:hypothetical protein